MAKAHYAHATISTPLKQHCAHLSLVGQQLLQHLSANLKGLWVLQQQHTPLQSHAPPTTTICCPVRLPLIHTYVCRWLLDFSGMCYYYASTSWAPIGPLLASVSHWYFVEGTLAADVPTKRRGRGWVLQPMPSCKQLKRPIQHTVPTTLLTQ